MQIEESDDPASLESSSDADAGEYSSGTAYVLVYQLMDDEPKKEPELPCELQTWIKELNEQNTLESTRIKDEQLALKTQMKAKSETWSKIVDILKAGEFSDDEVFFYVSRQAMDDIISGEIECIKGPRIPENRKVSNSAIVCIHGKIDPETLMQSVRLPVDSFNAVILTSNVELEPVLSSGEHFCSDCALVIFAKYKEQYEHESDITRLKGDPKAAGKRYHISRSWYDCWKRKNMTFGCKMLRPDDPIYISDVYCSHGNLSANEADRILISSHAFNIISERFQGFFALDEFSAAVCVDCTIQHAADIAQINDVVHDALLQKQALKRLFVRTKRVHLDLDYFMVPNSFMAIWKSFVFDAAHYPAPSTIDTSSLICAAHSKLIYDINTDNTNEVNFTLVTQEEWCALIAHYDCPQEIKVVKTTIEDQVFLSCDISVCGECRLKRLHTYTSGKITVEKVGEMSDFQVNENKLEYQVEKIVGHRKLADGTPQFKVRWKGHSLSSDTWEPLASFNDESMLLEYLSAYGIKGTDLTSVDSSETCVSNENEPIDIDMIDSTYADESTPKKMNAKRQPSSTMRSQRKKKRNSTFEIAIHPDLTVQQLSKLVIFV